jgi:hypothetical protein
VKTETGYLRVVPPGPRQTPQPRTLIVGITGDGYVPVVEDALSDETGGFTGAGRSLIGLPSIVLGSAGPASGFQKEEAVEFLRQEFGYEAMDLVPMGPGAAPGFLLAPMLRSAGWRQRVGFVPGVYEVSLRGIPGWLWRRRLAGAVEAAGLRRGLSLAREFFPRWARARLSRAIGEIEARAPEARRPA